MQFSLAPLKQRLNNSLILAKCVSIISILLQTLFKYIAFLVDIEFPDENYLWFLH